MRFLATLLVLSPLAEAADVPIPSSQIRRVDVSSTSDYQHRKEAVFRVRHLTDQRNWSAWGSDSGDTDGAWIQLQFDRVRYVSQLEFVPGFAKTKGTFKMCGRPANIIVSSGDDHRRFELEDARWKQTVALEPPLSGHALRVTVESVHAPGKRAGVCVSELKLKAPVDPSARIPELTQRLETAMALLADDGRARLGRRRLLAVGAPAVISLQAALDPANPNYAARAAEVLGQIGDRAAIPALAELAEHPDPQLRNAALWALGALGSGAHLDAVRAWFDETAGTDRDHAFEALARSGNARALEVVVAELVDGSQQRRKTAAEHLGRFGSDAVNALEPLLHSSVRRDRSAALDALGSVEHPEAERLLREGLSSAQSDVQAAAIRGLARRGGADAHARIATLWSSRYTEVRRATAAALGRFGDPGDLESLELLASDGSMSVRVAAATSLGALGPKAHHSLLGLALHGPEGATASAAAAALLESTGDPKTAVKVLRSRHAESREVAAAAIAEHGPSGRLAVVQAVTGDDDRVRGPAATLLRQIGAGAAPDLLVAAEDAAPEALPEVLDLLAEFGDPMAVTFAVPLVSEGDDLTTRIAAIRTLERCARDAAVADALLVALDDEMPEVRLAAIEALGTLQVARATDALTERLQGEEAPTRRAAARSLGLIRQRGSLQHLVDAWQHTATTEEDPRLREDLVVAIGRIGGRAGLKVLFDAARDHDERVAQAAARALQ